MCDRLSRYDSFNRESGKPGLSLERQVGADDSALLPMQLAPGMQDTGVDVPPEKDMRIPDSDYYREDGPTSFVGITDAIETDRRDSMDRMLKPLQWRWRRLPAPY